MEYLPFYVLNYESSISKDDVRKVRVIKTKKELKRIVLRSGRGGTLTAPATLRP